MAGQDITAREFQKRAARILTQVVKAFCDDWDRKYFEQKAVDIMFGNSKDANSFDFFSQDEMVKTHFDNAPQDFCIVTLNEGEVETFRELMEENNVEFINSTNADASQASRFIVNREDFLRFRENYPECVLNNPESQAALDYLLDEKEELEYGEDTEAEESKDTEDPKDKKKANEKEKESGEEKTDEAEAVEEVEDKELSAENETELEDSEIGEKPIEGEDLTEDASKKDIENGLEVNEPTPTSDVAPEVSDGPVSGDKFFGEFADDKAEEKGETAEISEFIDGQIAGSEEVPEKTSEKEPSVDDRTGTVEEYTSTQGGLQPERRPETTPETSDSREHVHTGNNTEKTSDSERSFEEKIEGTEEKTSETADDFIVENAARSEELNPSAAFDEKFEAELAKENEVSAPAQEPLTATEIENVAASLGAETSGPNNIFGNQQEVNDIFNEPVNKDENVLDFSAFNKNNTVEKTEEITPTAAFDKGFDQPESYIEGVATNNKDAIVYSTQSGSKFVFDPEANTLEKLGTEKTTPIESLNINEHTRAITCEVPNFGTIATAPVTHQCTLAEYKLTLELANERKQKSAENDSWDQHDSQYKDNHEEKIESSHEDSGLKDNTEHVSSEITSNIPRQEHANDTSTYESADNFFDTYTQENELEVDRNEWNASEQIQQQDPVYEDHAQNEQIQNTVPASPVEDNNFTQQTNNDVVAQQIEANNAQVAAQQEQAQAQAQVQEQMQAQAQVQQEEQRVATAEQISTPAAPNVTDTNLDNRTQEEHQREYNGYAQQQANAQTTVENNTDTVHAQQTSTGHEQSSGVFGTAYTNSDQQEHISSDDKPSVSSSLGAVPTNNTSEHPTDNLRDTVNGNNNPNLPAGTERPNSLSAQPNENHLAGTSSHLKEHKDDSIGGLKVNGGNTPHFSVSESSALQSADGGSKDLFLATVKKAYTDDRDKYSHVANAKQDLMVAKNIVGGGMTHVAGLSGLAGKNTLDNAFNYMSKDAQNTFDKLWAADDAARNRFASRGLTGGEARAAYLEELAQNGKFIEKGGLGTAKFQGMVDPNSMPGVHRNYRRQQPIKDVYRVNGETIRLSQTGRSVFDNRKASQVQAEFMTNKSTALMGKDIIKNKEYMTGLKDLQSFMKSENGKRILSARTNASAKLQMGGGWRGIIKRTIRNAQAKSNDTTSLQVQRAQGMYHSTKNIIHMGLSIREKVIVNSQKKLLEQQARLSNMRRNARKQAIDAWKREGNLEKAKAIKNEICPKIEKKLKKTTKKLKKKEKKLGKIEKRRKKKADKLAKKLQRKKNFARKRRNLRNKFRKSKFGRSRIGRAITGARNRARYTKLLTRRLNKRLAKALLNSQLGKLLVFLQKLSAILAEVLWKVALAIGAALVELFKICLKGAIAYAIFVGFSILISTFFYWEGEEEFNQEVEASVMGLVYEDLVNKETEWAKQLKKTVEKEYGEGDEMYFDDFEYTVFEGDSTINMSPQEYAESVLGAKFIENASSGNVWFDGHNGSWDGVQGPTPFANAPEEAYKTIIRIDGGRELLFIGAGGQPAKTSNAKEIVCMATLVQYESDMTYEDAPEKPDDTFFGKLGTMATKFSNFVESISNAIDHAVSGFVNKLGVAVQNAFNSDFYTTMVAKNESKIYYAYTHPLMTHSHVSHFGLKMVILPTVHSAGSSVLGDASAEYSSLATVCTGFESQKATGAPVDEHEGHGCMHYDGFTFDDPTTETLYYNGEAVPQAYPAGAIESDDLYNKDIPIAPGNEPEKFCKRYTYGNNKDCWSKSESGSEDYSDESSAPSTISYASGLGIGDVVDIYSEDGGRTYTAVVMSNHEVHAFSGDSDEDEDSDNDDDNDDEVITHSYTLTKYNFSYIGDNATHRGYYCGGHLILEVYGTVYTFTLGEMNSTKDAYDDKNLTSENPEDTHLPKYEVRALNLLNEDEAVIDKERMKNVQDLFDIDANLIHYKGLVHKDFPGWSTGSIDNAVEKDLEDWEKTYGIACTYTIGGADAGFSEDGTTVCGTPLSQAEIDAIIAELEANPDYANDPAWPQRKEVVKKALSFVGYLGYSMNHHTDELRKGGLTDCSGYASNVWHPYYGSISGTGGFVELGNQTGSRHAFHAENGQGHQAKPGDVIIAYTGAGPQGKHALVYIGIVNGVPMTADIGGSPPGCTYSHKKYLNKCDVIDMPHALGMY